MATTDYRTTALALMHETELVYELGQWFEFRCTLEDVDDFAEARDRLALARQRLAGVETLLGELAEAIDAAEGYVSEH